MWGCAIPCARRPRVAEIRWVGPEPLRAVLLAASLRPGQNSLSNLRRCPCSASSRDPYGFSLPADIDLKYPWGCKVGHTLLPCLPLTIGQIPHCVLCG